jgi:hypothetical protein
MLKYRVDNISTTAIRVKSDSANEEAKSEPALNVHLGNTGSKKWQGEVDKVLIG